MTSQRTHQRHLNLILGVLLGTAIVSPILVGNLASWSLPDWLGAAIAVGALIGALAVMWRQGALKVRYIFLLVVAMGAAPLLAWLSEHT
jgi:hypothetical protein